MADGEEQDKLSLLALAKRLSELEAQIDAQARTIEVLRANVDQTRLAEIEAALLCNAAITLVLHDHAGRSSIETNQRELRVRLEPIQNRVQASADAAAAALEAGKKKEARHAA